MADFPFTLSAPIGRKATIGLVVLQADETIEHDFRRLLPMEEVALYVTRVPSGLDVTPDSLQAMARTLPAAVALFPRSVSFGVIGYGCTSAASMIGPDKIAELVRSETATEAVTEPLSALVAACGSLGVSRLAMLSPYVEAVSQKLRSVLEDHDISTPDFGSFNESEEGRVARIAPESIKEGAIRLARASDAEAIFLSCTNLRTLDIITDVESAIGKPVLSSNQVLAWHMCKLAGLPKPPGSFGRLFA